MSRVFSSCPHFEEGQHVLLDPNEQHHLQRVLRLKSHDQVQIINGHGELATAEVVSGGCNILHVTRTSAQPGCRVAMPLLRPGHLDFAIEKLTEFGVTDIMVFRSDFSDRSELTPSLQRRLSSLMVAALKQSGQLFMPKLTYVHSLHEAIRLMPTPRLFADLQPQAQYLHKLLSSLQITEGVSVFIGPESGWSDDEKKLLASHAQCVLLHTNVLRAETAAVVAAYECSVFVQNSSRN
jgi:16S rRNA (uracil1498-N3)-methyltransferase